MPLSISRRRFLLCLIGPPVAGLTGCGTILYPERRGQPGGKIDWGVFALDALMLLFFFIPGVIAFAVDFTTGAIYLPSYEFHGAAAGAHTPLRTVHVPQDQLTEDGIARAVSQATGRRVVLHPGDYTTRRLPSIDDFWPTHARVQARS